MFKDLDCVKEMALVVLEVMEICGSVEQLSCAEEYIIVVSCLQLKMTVTNGGLGAPGAHRTMRKGRVVMNQRVLQSLRRQMKPA